ncbi:MAG: hypothetical protein PVG07_06200 [Acidobacteriota bacterium]|jgi:hypothetical protein
MCNQTVSLVAAELERRGIATVVIQLLREIAEAVRPPRALFVPFPLGYPFGAPDEPLLQRRILEAALDLLHDPAEPPILRDLPRALHEPSHAGSR